MIYKDFQEMKLSGLGLGMMRLPELIAHYNEHKITGGGFLAPMAIKSMPAKKRPANCIGCRSCEKVCPQQIKISEMMKDFTDMIGM